MNGSFASDSLVNALLTRESGFAAFGWFLLDQGPRLFKFLLGHNHPDAAARHGITFETQRGEFIRHAGAKSGALQRGTDQVGIRRTKGIVNFDESHNGLFLLRQKRGVVRAPDITRIFSREEIDRVLRVTRDPDTIEEVEVARERFSSTQCGDRYFSLLGIPRFSANGSPEPSGTRERAAH